MTNSPLFTAQSSSDQSALSETKPASALYDRDYFAWIESTIERLQQQDYSNVDWNNLIEEVADIGRSEKRRLESNLRIVLMHLLKWQHQPERRSGSWEYSIIEHRIRVRKNLKESPSLKPFLEREFSEICLDAIKLAAAETRLPIETFPVECPYTIAQVLDENFLPEQA